MTIVQYYMLLKNFSKKLAEQNRPFQIGVATSTQEVANRIFVDGKKSDGSDIGKYNDTDPLYVNPNKMPSSRGIKPTKGKDGKHLFNNGNEHKTTYVESYKELKRLLGRESTKVVPILSGDLQSDFRKVNGLKATTAKATRINANKYTIQLDRKENEGKMDGLNDRFGMVSDLTPGEIDNFYKVVDLELKNDLQKEGLL